jgi:hypothetical protein
VTTARGAAVFAAIFAFGLLAFDYAVWAATPRGDRAQVCAIIWTWSALMWLIVNGAVAYFLRAGNRA